MASQATLFCAFLVCLSCATHLQAEERGFGVGLVRKPTNCKRVTKRGDHIAVKYNGTFEDGTNYVPTR